MQTEIGNWILGEVLGEGGMGTVYLAHHKTLGTPAAFKVLAPALTRDPRFRERFVREAKAQAQLRHPGIAQVIDFIEQGDSLYLIMEYLPGGTLAELMEREKRPLPVAQSLAWTRRALSALDYAHQRGVIHRDVKPSNILFDENGQPKVVDFGIALILDGRRLTTTGTLGTPHYMSPEQIRRPLEVDHRTDVYAMGVVLYEMLAGRAPFDGESDFDITYAQVNEPPKPLRSFNPEVKAELEAIVFQALAKKPEERLGGCGAMEKAIAALEPGQTSPPPVPPTPPPLPAPSVDEKTLAPLRAAVTRWKVGAAATIALGLVALGITAGVKNDAIRSEQLARNEVESKLSTAETNLAWLHELNDAKSWPLLGVDTFWSDLHVWNWGGLGPNEFGTGYRSLANGVYAWAISPSKSVSWIDTYRGSDLGESAAYLSVETTQVSGGEDDYSGLSFRSSGGNYYAFEVSRGMYRLLILNHGKWTTLREPTASTTIRSGKANRLGILIQGSQFRLFVNDQLVDNISDDTLKTGACGLVAESSRKNEMATFAFSNFELRRKPS